MLPDFASHLYAVDGAVLLVVMLTAVVLSCPCVSRLLKLFNSRL